MTTLTSKEIERKRLLVSKFKEDAINHIEIQELMAILEKEKHIAEEEEEEERDGMLVFAYQHDPDRAGFIIHNLEGQPNMKINLGTIYYLANKDFIDVYTILDNDQEADGIIKKYNIDKARYHKWNRDFEYDNFGIDTIVNYVNSVLKLRDLKQITKNEVEKEFSSTNNAIMNIINNIVIPRENKRKYEIYKKSMCKDLIADRIKEIEVGRKSGRNWEASLPIEHILKKVFEIFPEISFA